VFRKASLSDHDRGLLSLKGGDKEVTVEVKRVKQNNTKQDGLVVTL
jgi:hypothetical protein